MIAASATVREQNKKLNQWISIPNRRNVNCFAASAKIRKRHLPLFHHFSSGREQILVDFFDFSIFFFWVSSRIVWSCCRQQTERSFSSAAGNYFFDLDEKKVKRTESDPLVFFSSENFVSFRHRNRHLYYCSFKWQRKILAPMRNRFVYLVDYFLKQKENGNHLLSLGYILVASSAAGRKRKKEKKPSDFYILIFSLTKCYIEPKKSGIT